MSKCELTLTFDSPDLTYHFGEKISGTVLVCVSSQCQCRGLLLERQWRTHGKGDSRSSKQVPLILFRGTWEPGLVYRYPFSFIAPNGPATYHGHDLNVDWYVRARADFPLARDPRLETEILLVAPSPADSKASNGMSSLGPKYKTPEPIIEEINPGSLQTIVAVSFLALGLSSVLSYIFPYWFVSADNSIGLDGLALILTAVFVFRFFFTGHKASTARTPAVLLSRLALGLFGAVLGLRLLGPETALIGGAVVTAMGLYGIYWAIGFRMLGSVKIEIQPAMVRRGESMVWTVRVRASAGRVLSGAEGTLSAKEITVSIAGTGTTTHTHLVYETEIPLVPRVESGGENMTLEGSFIVPDYAPLTFSDGSNELKWEAGVRISVKNLPAWGHVYPVAVCP